MNRAVATLSLALVAAGLGGCTYSQVHLSDNYGAAVRQDVVAQITDPDPHYRGPPPPANGARVVLGQVRYRTGTTIPAAAEASSIGMDVGPGAAPPPGTPAGAPPAAGP
jgi:hypothetical protein